LSKAVKNKKVIIYQNGKFEEETLGVPVEMPAQFIINDRELLKIMVTPTQLREFAIGFLAGQGLIEKLDEIKTELVGEKKAILYFEIKKDIFADNLTSISYLNPGCGGGVSFKALNLPKVKTSHKFKTDDLLDLMKEVLKSAQLYKSSGGFHTAGLSVAGKLMFTAEDIGRHNAVDKVIGSGFINSIDFSSSALFSTGRITFEGVAKAARVNIPVLVSRSSPTNLAVSLAEKQGITLLGYVRGGKARIYSNFERLEEK
jgi:FdhD protein